MNALSSPAPPVASPPPKRFATPRLDLAWDRTVLSLCAGTLALSLLLTVAPGGDGIQLFGLPVPGRSCASKFLTGLDCPGCGLTRSFLSLAHRRWEEAWHFNRAGGLLFAAMLFQFPYRGLRLLRRTPYSRRFTRAMGVATWLVFAGPFANWTFNLVSGVPPLP